MCLLIDNICHIKRNDYKIDMAIYTFWHESIVHKIWKVLINFFSFLAETLTLYDAREELLGNLSL